MLRTSASAVVVAVFVAAFVVGSSVCCTAAEPVVGAHDVVARDDHDDDALTLEAFERGLRPAVRERVLAGERADHGADPVALARRGDDVFVLLRGRDRLQVIGGPSAATAPSPSAVVVDGDDVVVGSGVVGGLQRFRLVSAVPWIAGQGEGASSLHLQPVAAASPSFDGVSALSAGKGLIDVGTVDGDVVTVRGSTELSRCRVGLGVSSLVRLPRHLVALSSLQHAVVVYPLDDDGAPVCALSWRADFDAPLFSLIAFEDADTNGGVDVVVSGIEDHPLDRTGGSFGHIDSFLFRLRFDDDGLSRLWETNLSEHGVVNGKALLRRGDDVVVYGAGSGRSAVIDLETGAVTSTAPSLFGVGAAIAVGGDQIVGSALEDAVDVAGVVTRFDGPASAQELLGERLVFTTAMAPRQRSEGALSRFTCESCHLQGGTDGRVHQTGRTSADGPVTATTKPLWGLFQNPPLFTRALDRSVAVMAHAEVKVANANSPQDPWFSARVDDDDDAVSPLEMRRALIAFFASSDPPPNPRAAGRSRLDDDEALGLLHFNRRCVSCHDARVFADTPEEGAVDVVTALLRGALVFGRSGHEDTGVRPRVHPQGARPSSLRGTAFKTPLLTSGKAQDLSELLEQVRVVDGRVTHEGTAGQRLSSSERALLLRFLRLL